MMVSHSNRLWLMFRSDSSATFPGFRAHWDGTQTGGCVGEMSISLASSSTGIVIHTLKCTILEILQILTPSLCLYLSPPIPLLLFMPFPNLGCGGTLTTSSGGFSSPNYPLPYHTNAECYWLIKAGAGSLITLSFGDFDLESSTSCTYDYLAVSTEHCSRLSHPHNSQYKLKLNRRDHMCL